MGKQSPETIANRIAGRKSANNRNKGTKVGPAKRVICPHCLTEGGINIMKRWHFGNCSKAVKGVVNGLDN